MAGPVPSQDRAQEGAIGSLAFDNVGNAVERTGIAPVCEIVHVVAEEAFDVAAAPRDMRPVQNLSRRKRIQFLQGQLPWPKLFVISTRPAFAATNGLIIKRGFTCLE